MLDIKHIDNEEHKKLTTHSNSNILAFARYLDRKKIEGEYDTHRPLSFNARTLSYTFILHFYLLIFNF